MFFYYWRRGPSLKEAALELDHLSSYPRGQRPMTRPARALRAQLALCASLFAVTVVSVSGFAPFLPRVAVRAPSAHASASRARGTRLSMSEEELPGLTDTPPLNVGLMVEPTPFTHVSGYSNRYKEMLTYLKKAGDKVCVCVCVCVVCMYVHMHMLIHT
jgi:hypothetical protein